MGKIIKKILKIIGKTLLGILGFAVLCAVVTVIWGTVQKSRGTVTDKLPETPEDFTPSVRVMVFTDCHNNNENVANAIDKANEMFNDDEKYAGMDAIFCLGDFSSIGTEPDYDSYIEAVKAHEKEGTPVITLLGNHEMKQTYCEELFQEKFGYPSNDVYEINGFSFIAFSGERSLTEWTFTPSSLKWCSEQVKAAEAKAGDKPVFVMQHPHNFGTVYGSTIWCTPQTNVVFNGHNKVVNFSGHSHFPMEDPRSINQSTYTNIGVGGLCRFEFDKDYLPGQHPDGYDTANEFLILEADNDGSVRILEYDMNSGIFFNEYYIDNVNDQDSYAYTYKNMKAHDSAPVFAENTKASATKNEDGEWVLSFDEAHCNFVVHDYKVVIKDASGNKVHSGKYIDDYYVHDEDDTADFRIGKDTLKSGETYTLEVVATSAYHLKSDKLTVTFTAQ